MNRRRDRGHLPSARPSAGDLRNASLSKIAPRRAEGVGLGQPRPGDCAPVGVHGEASLPGVENGLFTVAANAERQAFSA